MGKINKIQHKKVKGEKMEYRSVSLPTSLVEDLAILRECYEDVWFPLQETEGPKKKRKAVSYEKVFERLLSKSGLGHVDPDVYQKFITVRKTRKEFPEVVKVSTRKTVEELTVRAKENGTSLKKEAAKEQERAKAELDLQRRVKEEVSVKLTFGKHNGKTIQDIYLSDPTYVTEFLPKVNNNQKITLSSEALEYLRNLGSPAIFRGRLSEDSTQPIHEEEQI